MKPRSILCYWAGVFVLATGLPILGVAQSVPSRSWVTITRIKPEMLNQWLDLQKNEALSAVRKKGVTTRTVYASGFFGDAFEYIIVQPMAKFADFDSPDAQTEVLGTAANAQLAEKLRKCIVSSSSFVSTDLPELSSSNEGGNPPSPILNFIRVRVAPGKMQEYENLFKAEVLPAFKKVNSSITAARRGLGADGNDVTFEMPLAKFADLDAPPPLVRALGLEGAAKLMAQFNAMATVVENTVLIRQADLSF